MICDTAARAALWNRSRPQRGEGQRTSFAILLHGHNHEKANGRRATEVDTHDLRYCCTGIIMKKQSAAERQRSTHMISDTVARAKLLERNLPQSGEGRPT